VVWTPAFFEWANGGEAAGLIPTRYAGSEQDERPEIRLARRTDWMDEGDGLYLGKGQRLFTTDQGEYPIMDTRLIELNVAEVEPGDGGETQDG